MRANTELRNGTPLEAEDTVIKVAIIEPEDPRMHKGVQKGFKERFPELTILKESYDTIEQSITTKTKNGEITRHQKIVKITYNGTEGDIWEKLKRLKEETEGDALIAIHQINGMSQESLRKMLETIFHESHSRVLVITDFRRAKIKVPHEKTALAKRSLHM